MLRAKVVACCVLTLAACTGDGGDEGGSDGAGSDGEQVEATTTTLSIEHRLDETLRLHQVQVLGSHNSYHLRGHPEVLDAIRAVDPAQALALEYEHRPLPEQFADLGIRQIELDVYPDPEGGAYAGTGLAAALGVADDDPALAAPGFKVLHDAEFDARSSCVTFVACLEQVAAWSRDHPGHVPVTVLVEVKDPAADTASLAALDAEIRSVFADDELLTPDDVRGSYPTLGEAVATEGWPVLGSVRGTVLFALDNDSLRDVYREGAPALEGRVLFTPSVPGEADAAFAKLNDPVADGPAIAAALAANMLVRTRADADTLQARADDTTMRDAALASGAQLVSTDYPEPDGELSPYVVRIPGGTPARCNPVTAPADCTGADVEDPERLG